MRVAIFDYGAGNLHSLAKAVARAGVEPRIESDPIRCLEASVLVLPGVGSFGQASARLGSARGQVRAALGRGLPCLGICLGMQLMFERSEEGGDAGLGLFAGDVTRLRGSTVPQIGWNAIEAPSDPAFARVGLQLGYYANSYACRPKDLDQVVAWSEHETDRFPAAVRRGSILGLQFHPEKSSEAGVRLIGDYFESVRR